MNYYDNKIARNIAFTVGASIVDAADLSIFDMHHYVSAMSKDPIDNHLLMLANEIEGTHQDDILWSKRSVYMSRLIAKKIILARLNYMGNRDYVWGNNIINQMNKACPDFDLYEYLFFDKCCEETVGKALSTIEKATYYKNKLTDYFKRSILKEGSFAKFFDDIAPLPEAGRYGCITLLVARVIIPWMLYGGDKAVKKVEKLLLNEKNPEYKENTEFLLLLYQLENFTTQANSLNLHFSEDIVVLWNNVLGYLTKEANSLYDHKHEEFTFAFAVFCCVPYPFNYLNSAVNYSIQILARDILHRVEISKDILEDNRDAEGNLLLEGLDELEDVDLYFKLDDITETILTSSLFERERFVEAVLVTNIEEQIDKAGMEDLKESSDDTVSGNFDISFSFDQRDD